MRVGLAFCGLRDLEVFLEVLLEVLLLALADELLRVRCWAKVNEESELARRTVANRTLMRTAGSV